MIKKTNTLKRIKSQTILKQLQEADNLYNQSKFNDAIEIYKKIIPTIDNSYTFDKSEIYRKLGNNYYALNDYDNSIEAYEKTLKFYTNNASIYKLLGFMYFYKDSNKSIEYYLNAMKLKPNLKDFIMLTQVMIKSKNYSQIDLKHTFEKYVNIFRPEILNGEEPFSYTKDNLDENKKLNIAYLSSDFHCHAMMSFILPILENHDKNEFNITLYSCGKQHDNTTQRIKNTGLKFEDCSDLTNKQLADKIHSDNIDILIDISGYTHNAIWTLLFKPAPIQIQFLGFLGTYGMKEVDYILADKFSIPEYASKDYTEHPLYIDCGMNRFTFNTINQQLPDVTPLPCLKNGYITFGSFNCLSKLNPYTISLWSKILKAVENSKILIYRTQMQDRDIERFKVQFSKNGIPEDRLIFNNTPQEGSHFKSYPLCDIALDPIPFNGLTITIEELHMGVPVLTLIGETISGKGAARVNKTLGLDDFIASNENEFIEKAVKISKDVEKLTWYRKNLREIVKNSILCKDSKNYAECIEKAYKTAWKEYCKK